MAPPLPAHGSRAGAARMRVRSPRCRTRRPTRSASARALIAPAPCLLPLWCLNNAPQRACIASVSSGPTLPYPSVPSKAMSNPPHAPAPRSARRRPAFFLHHARRLRAPQLHLVLRAASTPGPNPSPVCAAPDRHPPNDAAPWRVPALRPGRKERDPGALPAGQGDRRRRPRHPLPRPTARAAPPLGFTGCIDTLSQPPPCLRRP